MLSRLLHRFRPLELFHSNYFFLEEFESNVHIFRESHTGCLYISRSKWSRLPIIGWWFDVATLISNEDMQLVKQGIAYEILGQLQGQPQRQQKIIQYLDNSEDTDALVFAEGFDDAILGFDDASNRVIYSSTLCINILQSQGMTEDKAFEFFEFKVKGSYIGMNTPIFMEDLMFDDYED